MCGRNKIRYLCSMTVQKCTDLDWEDVRFFLALARHASLSAAARALSVNHATVARRIRSLETGVGDYLVERRPDGYVLTALGTRVLASALAMETAAGVMSRRQRLEGPSGLVRINAPPSLSQMFLAGKLARLVQQYAGLDLELAADFRAVSLERGETDIAVRYGKPDDGDVIATRAGKLGFGFYATKACAARSSAKPVFIGFDEANGALPEAQWLSRRFPGSRFALRVNSQVAQASAARTGLGFALLPHIVARQTPGLVLCELKHTPPTREIWLLTRSRDRNNRAIRTVRDFLIDSFRKEQRSFET